MAGPSKAFHARHGPRGQVNAQIDLTPLTSIVGTVPLRLPLGFTWHLDAAAVNQQVQSRRRPIHADRHRQVLLTSADRAEGRYLAVQAGQLEQALRRTIA